MTWLKSVFLCCALHDQAEAKPQQARVVAVTTNECYNGRRARAPRYHDSPPAYVDIARQPLISVDEKNHAEFQVHRRDPNEPSRPTSPVSSIVSVPSTRVTDLTALRTGDTAVASTRGSLDRVWTRESRPPSYYSTVRRSSSPTSSVGLESGSTRDEVWQHPVMRSDWLEVLQHDARRHAVVLSSAYRESRRAHPS
jgi:hypothetical protein